MSLATRLSAFAQAVGADIKLLNSKIPYKGNWSGAATYNKGDLVWYSNDLWVAVATITGAGNFPSTDYPTAWRLVTEGMPIGGAVGQVLIKNSATSFDTTWGNPASANAFSAKVNPSADFTIPAATTAVPGLTATVTEASKYMVTFTGDLNIGPANGYVIVYVAVNGVAVGEAGVKQTYSTDPSARFPFNKEWLLTLNAGDVVTIRMSNNAHASNNISAVHSSMIVARTGGPKGDKGDKGDTGLISDPGYRKSATAGGTAAASGPGNAASWVYGSVFLDLTPGTWRIEAAAMMSGNVADYACVGIYNETDAVLMGAGEGHYVGTAAQVPMTNVRGYVIATVTKNTRVKIAVYPSGASTQTIPATSTMSVAYMEAWLVGPGPKGDKGDTGATGGNATVPIEAWRVVGTAGNPAFAAGFNALDEIGFRKDPLGMVRLRGSVGSASGSGATVFTLPVGYRPPQRYRAVSVGNQTAVGQWEAQINVNTDGTVVVYFTGASATAYVSLDQVAFDTATVTQMPTGPKGDPGGIAPVKTLNWNTAIVPGIYRSTNDGLEQTINGPGDTLNPPPQVGSVYVHENGGLVQKVWDLSFQKAYTRFRGSDNTWTTWVPDVIKPTVWTDVGVTMEIPKDGDERYFQNATMKAAGVMWKFRYDGTAPSGKPKWLFVGGQGMYDRNDGDNFATPAATWVDAGAAGPGFVLPLAGDYMVDYGGLIYSNIPGVYAQIGLSVAGVVSGYNIIHGNFGAGYTDYEDQSRSDRIDNCGQGALLKLVYQSNPTGGGYQRRWIRVTPIRVTM